MAYSLSGDELSNTCIIREASYNLKLFLRDSQEIPQVLFVFPSEKGGGGG